MSKALMLAKTGDEKLLENPNYAGELKLDGTRGTIIKKDDAITILNRHGVDYTLRLPEIVESARQIAANFVMDMEICYFENGRTVFKGSQSRCSSQSPTMIRLNSKLYPVKGMVFDLMHLDGKPIENYPFEKRKDLLRQLVKESNQTDILYVPHVVEDKKKFYEEVTARGEEGLMLKQLGSRYEYRRSPAWRKVKHWDEELVKVVGYTEGTGKRANLFGSLILAVVDDNGYLQYRGKVGTGFNDSELKHLTKMLKQAETDTQMVTHENLDDDITWVDTPLELTVKYYELTEKQVARMPSMLKVNGVNQIHYDGTLEGKVKKPTDLRSLLNRVKE